jgi:CubicO group peptidase (beta-lactamase class C family)
VSATGRRRWLRAGLLVLGVSVLGGLVFVNRKIAPTGTGYCAKIMCSAVFVSGLDPERVEREELRPYWYVKAKVDHSAGTVTARLFGMAPRTAVYREGLGCTLAVGIGVEELRAQIPELAPRPKLADRAWPVGDVVTQQVPPDVDTSLLAEAVEYAFAEPDPNRPLLTRALLVVYRDQLIAERYADGISAETPLAGWSMTKSVHATLIGILEGQGTLDIDAPAPVPDWQADERAEITVDQLLRMSSGLEFEEVYGPLSDATAMLFESHSSAHVAMTKPLAVAPDTVWSYSSGTSNVLAWIVRETVEREGGWPAYASFPRRVLFDPIGMTSAVMEPDPSGTFVASSFMLATARDWARFGLLHLHDGVWQGQRILPEGWVAYVSTATPAAPTGEYGAQWWTNDGAPGNASERRFPSAPTDAFQASGYQGQAVIVIPSRDVVIVRMGMSHDRELLDLDGVIGRVLAALPETARGQQADRVDIGHEPKVQ